MCCGKLLAGEGVFEIPPTHEAEIRQTSCESSAKKSVAGLIAPQSIRIAHHHRISFPHLKLMRSQQCFSLVCRLLFKELVQYSAREGQECHRVAGEIANRFQRLG